MSNILKIFNLENVPKAPLFLGLSGIIPFIFLTIGIWFFPYDLKLFALYNLLNYSVIIISFLGAIYWGVAMRNEKKSFKPYFISVIPSILSWFMLMGFFSHYLLILVFIILTFFCIYFMDIKYVKSGFFPEWYGSLRKTISIIIVLTLGLASIGVNIKIL